MVSFNRSCHILIIGVWFLISLHLLSFRSRSLISSQLAGYLFIRMSLLNATNSCPYPGAMNTSSAGCFILFNREREYGARLRFKKCSSCHDSVTMSSVHFILSERVRVIDIDSSQPISMVDQMNQSEREHDAQVCYSEVMGKCQLYWQHDCRKSVHSVPDLWFRLIRPT